ncbi:MAG TPA: hypothetical protein VH234_01075 [Candidatus Saccharimonadales bacterium]|jgi:hypothetical protein|nr:hypothetical protein [Candidatus Saccharimonadales bacterium]
MLQSKYKLIEFRGNLKIKMLVEEEPPGTEFQVFNPEAPLIEGGVNQSEQPPENQRIEFTDSRGVVRKPHELAAEVILSDEIETAVDDHFGEVYEALPRIDQDLDELEATIEHRQEHRRQVFNPFDETFLGELRAKVLEQMDRVTEEQPTTKVIEVEKKGLFGRTKAVQRTIETTESVPIEGYTLGFSEREQQDILRNHPVRQYKDQRFRDASGRLVTHTREQNRDTLIKTLQEITRGLLCDEKLDVTKASQQHVSGTRLPLLAKRLFDAGVDPNSLDEETLYKLVPELEPVKKAVDTARDTIDTTLLNESMYKIRQDIHNLLPDSEFVTSLYYSDEDLTMITKRYGRLREIVASVYPEKVGDADYYNWAETAENFLESARSRIEQFFSNAVSADELLMHSTPFAPRIIKSGYIKPSAVMGDDEFTFNTRRSHDEESSHEGSNAVHFSGLNRTVYDYNRQPSFWLGMKTLSQPELEEEKAKGGFGHAVIGIRIGDIISSAPYMGNFTNSDEADRTQDKHTHKQALIQLTETGYQKVAQKLRSRADDYDCVYTAAPANASKEEAFNYAFPVSKALIAIGSKSREAVLASLRAAGWSDEAVDELTFIFDAPELSQTDIPKKMQEKANEQGRYHNCIVGNLSRSI